MESAFAAAWPGKDVPAGKRRTSTKIAKEATQCEGRGRGGEVSERGRVRERRKN